MLVFLQSNVLAKVVAFFFDVVLETKWTKSGGKSQFSLSFLSSTVNDVRRKLYMVGIHLTVGKPAKRMPDTTVETTFSKYLTL